MRFRGFVSRVGGLGTSAMRHHPNSGEALWSSTSRLQRWVRRCIRRDAAATSSRRCRLMAGDEGDSSACLAFSLWPSPQSSFEALSSWGGQSLSQFAADELHSRTTTCVRDSHAGVAPRPGAEAATPPHLFSLSDAT